jgi:hypothetical protein
MLNPMTHHEANSTEPAAKKFRLGCLPILGIIAAAVLVTALFTGWWFKTYIYASKFTPTRLSAREQKVLDTKLDRLEKLSGKQGASSRYLQRQKVTPLKPEPYTEKGASREISLTEKEVNAMIANQPEIAERVAIDLSDELMSVKLVVPMDQEILFLGGKTLRLNLGLALKYENERPVVALQGVSLGGIPLPNAWLGNMKYKNLVDEFGTEGGFWKIFADGVEDLQLKQGQLRIKLKE